jgi:hypothetical protein
MDLRREILKKHSKEQKNKIVSYVGNSGQRFGELVEVFLEGPYRVTQRAAWPLTYVVEYNPELMLPHLKRILNFLDQKEIHDAVKRNVMRLLQFIEIPKQHESKVTELCFTYLNNRKEPIAIRVFAMTVLAKMAARHPELTKELVILIEDEMPFASPAFLSRGKKVLKQLSAF